MTAADTMAPALTSASAAASTEGSDEAHALEAGLAFDPEAQAARICAWMSIAVGRDLHRRGVVLGVSGGIDSSVCAALAARALGPDRVFALLMPERDSSPDSLARGLELVRHLGIAHEVHDLAPALAAIGCYAARDAAYARVFPEYGPGWRAKIALGGQAPLRFFRLIVADPQGRQQEARLSARDYLQIVAATNHKQRLRKAVEYFHGDRLNRAVIGTPNRLEHELGFFVRNGDGAADLKPIAHLYKTQVYALARHLGLPPRICAAVPSTDTYSLTQGQDEFYFALAHPDMDRALWAHGQGWSAARLAAGLACTPEQAAAIFADIEGKQRVARGLHAAPLQLGGAAAA